MVNLQLFGELHRHSKHHLLISTIIFCVLFVFLHECDLLVFTSTNIILAWVSWQAAKLIKRFFPGKRVSPRNKVVLITGCDSGFGHGLARKLCTDGYTVMAACLSPKGDGARSLQEDFSNERMQVLGMDITKDEDVKEAVQIVKSRLTDEKKLWAVVNNAGILYTNPIELTSLEECQMMIDVNQLGPIRVTKAFLPLLRQSVGRIVIVASVAGRLSVPSIVPYSMTKHAVVALADGLRRELIDTGIKIITIEPTVYRTNIIPNGDVIRTRLEAGCNDLAERDPQFADYCGPELLEDIIRRSIHICTSARTNINEVIETMVNAVTLEDPEATNSVGGAIDRIGVWVYSVSPTFIQDFIVQLMEISRWRGITY